MKKIPYRLIGLIIAEHIDDSGMGQKVYGTGTLISPDLVLTVAHNIFCHKWGKKPVLRQNQNFKFYLAQNGKLGKYYEVDGYYYPNEFRSQNLPKYDYAIMKLRTVTEEKLFMNLADLSELSQKNKNKNEK